MKFNTKNYLKIGGEKMEEKKSIKVSLGTVICMFIIFILIIALIGMYVYYNYILTDNKNKVETNNEIFISALIPFHSLKYFSLPLS